MIIGHMIKEEEKKSWQKAMILKFILIDGLVWIQE